MRSRAARWQAFPTRFGISIAIFILVQGCARPNLSYSGTNEYVLPDAPNDKVVYRDLGPRDAPLTVLMLHGAGVSKIVWKEAEARLSVRYRTINIDLPGHGASSMHPELLEPADVDHSPRHPYTLGNQGRFLARFIQNLDLTHDGRLVLVGMSYGGGVALEAYKTMPESQRAAVRGLFGLRRRRISAASRSFTKKARRLRIFLEACCWG